MDHIKIAVPDLVSNSYFPAIAAIELGFFKHEGLAATHELLFPNVRTYQALKDGSVNFVAAPAHVALSVFPRWQGAKLLCALAQGLFWVLVMRTGLGAVPGDINAVRGRRIGAAPMVDLALKQMLVESGIDLGRDGVTIDRVPGTMEPGVSFGVAAAKALADGKIDGFWANAMGAENAVQSGVGEIILDVRRGLGPAAARNYTISAFSTSDEFIEAHPQITAAAVRAVIKAQRALKAEPHLAAEVGRRIFPAAEAKLIENIVRRDLPYYDPEISAEVVKDMNEFCKDVGLLEGLVSYEDVVAKDSVGLWTER